MTSSPWWTAPTSPSMSSASCEGPRWGPGRSTPVAGTRLAMLELAADVELVYVLGDGVGNEANIVILAPDGTVGLARVPLTEHAAQSSTAMEVVGHRAVEAASELDGFARQALDNRNGTLQVVVEGRFGDFAVEAET